MSGSTVKTEGQLEEDFPDNLIKEITAADSRNFIHSCFGWISGTAPTVNNDNVDTAGIGQFFDTGSRWYETVRGRLWKCASGAPGAAVWQAQMYDGQTASGRLAGTYPNPRLGNSGVVPGTYGDPSHWAAFTVQADGTLVAAAEFPASIGGSNGPFSVGWYLSSGGSFSGLPTIGTYTLQDGETVYIDDVIGSLNAGPWVVHTGSWTRPSYFTNGSSFTGYVHFNVLSTRNESFGSGQPSLFMLSPYATGDVFTAWVVGTDVIKSFKVGTGGILVTGTGNITVVPAVAQPTNFPGSFVVSLVSVPVVAGIEFTPSTAPTGPSIYVDNATNVFIFIDGSGNSFPISLGASTGLGLVCVTIPVDYTQFSGIGSTTGFVQIASFPIQSFLTSPTTIGDVTWAVSGGTITSSDWQYSPDGGTTWLSLGIFQVGVGTDPVAAISFSGTNYANPLWTTTPLLVRVKIVATVPLTNLIQGHTRAFLIIGRFQ